MVTEIIRKMEKGKIRVVTIVETVAIMEMDRRRIITSITKKEGAHAPFCKKNFSRGESADIIML